MKKYVFSFLTVLSAVVTALADVPEPECACVERILCTEVKPEDAALFGDYFGNTMQSVDKSWDAEKLIGYASSWGFNEARKRVLRERIVQLSEDGGSLRYLSCERFEGADGRRVNYRERVQRSVVPFVFMSSLTRIVDSNDERVYFDIVKFNPKTRRIDGVEQRSWSRAELLQSAPQNEEKKLKEIQPNVFLELLHGHELVVTIEERDPQSGEWLGTRTKVYDFVSTELLKECTTRPIHP